MKSNNTGKLFVRLFVFAVSLILVGADPGASAQNSNSSAPTQEDAASQNSNTPGTNMNRGGRRRHRRGRTVVAGDTPAEGQLGPGDESVTDRPALPDRPQTAGRCDPMTQEQTDLSGAYTGRVGYSDTVMPGDGTLTISGNDFTLSSGPTTQEGRVYAVTTCNYTAVTMKFGKDEAVAPGQTPPPPPPIISLRARRTGGGLTLETVPGERRMFSFTSTGARSGGRRGTRGGMKGGGMKGGPPPVGIKPPTAM